MVSEPLPEPSEPSPVLLGPPHAERPAVMVVAAPRAPVYLMKVRRSTPVALRGVKEPSWRESKTGEEAEWLILYDGPA
ncbi:hypothetical protein GCM10018771_47210 [Streptomyces cellulosae]|nr:hypothetical protein GCM10018771_47210 [Streptomyces cellulosae]